MARRERGQAVFHEIRSMSAVAALESQATSQIQYFDLGLTLGRLKEFNAQWVPDLYDQCEALGLTFSASKVRRILDVWEPELEAIEEGGGYPETERMFERQMVDMEDAIRTELARH